MMKCPFCAEEIQDKAIKCKHCGEWLREKSDPPRELNVSKVTELNIEDQDKNESISKPSLAQSKKSLKGVGGWLLFFCISLIILVPIASVYSIIKTYQEVSIHFGSFPRLELITIINIFLSILITIFSMYAGISLWKTNKNAIRIVKLYLIALLFYKFSEIILILFTGFPDEVTKKVVGELSKEFFSKYVIAFVIWYSYFNKSQRIKNTFGAK